MNLIKSTLDDIKRSVSPFKICLYISVIIFLLAKNVKTTTEEINVDDDKVSKRYQVAKFNFEEVSQVYAITLWILLGSLAKIGKPPIFAIDLTKSPQNKQVSI